VVEQLVDDRHPTILALLSICTETGVIDLLPAGHGRSDCDT
jgi:hypothetical protein